MIEIIFNLVFAIPAVLGLAEIMHALKLWLLKPTGKGKRIMVLVPSDDFERQILSVYEQFKWQGKRFADEIVVVDCLLAENEECKRITEELGIRFCTLSELSDSVF